MACIIDSTPNTVKKARHLIPSLTRKLPYEIPEKYQNSFYLANASVFDNINWFLHRSYEILFPTLRATLQNSPDAKLTVDESIDKLNGIIKILDQCNTLIDLRFPVKRDNGSYEVVRGYKGQYGMSTGQLPCFGGLRYDDEVTRDDIKGMSALAMYKNCCVGINCPGAHGTIKIDPNEYSENELQSIVKQYAAELYQKGMCDERSNVFQPDMKTTEKEMNWISNTYSELTGCFPNCVSTGKSVNCDGLDGFKNSSGLGAYYAMDFFLRQDKLLNKIGLSKGVKDKTFIIQGLGKTGTTLAKTLIDNGAKCIGVKEIDSYLYDPKGIDIQDLLEHIKKHGTMKHYHMAKSEVNDDIYKFNCDILIFAARHKSLICYVADKVKAKLVVEAADGAMTPASNKILSLKKLVIPDIYAGSGCNIASFIEYLRTLQILNVPLTDTLRYADKIYEEVLNMINKNFEEMIMSSSTSKIDVVSTKQDPAFLPKSIRLVVDDVGQNIMNTLEEFQLGLDVRSACYIVSLQKIYKKMFDNKKFL